jgi:serine/threonine protein kinase
MHKNTPEDYELLKLIGRGSYAKVMLARRKGDGKVCALKVMKKKHIELKKQTEHILA